MFKEIVQQDSVVQVSGNSGEALLHIVLEHIADNLLKLTVRAMLYRTIVLLV